MLPKDLMADFQATVHALRYVLFISTWDEKGASGKYRGNQRLTYVITFYAIALAAITGGIALGGWWGDVGTTLHVVAAIMVLLVSAFRIVYLLKKRDWIAWRSILVTGRMPAWYVRENHPVWYEQLQATSTPGEGKDGTSPPMSATGQEPSKGPITDRPGKDPGAVT
jgi:cytochrome b subunit of formate dehydrogenase